MKAERELKSKVFANFIIDWNMNWKELKTWCTSNTTYDQNPSGIELRVEVNEAIW